MGLRVSDVINKRIKKAKVKADKAWMANCFVGYELKLAVADERLLVLKSLKKELLKNKLISY